MLVHVAHKGPRASLAGNTPHSNTHTHTEQNNFLSAKCTFIIIGCLAADPSPSPLLALPPPSPLLQERLVAMGGKLVTLKEQAGEAPNGTQFMITTGPSPQLDATNLVVGKVCVRV